MAALYRRLFLCGLPLAMSATGAMAEPQLNPRSMIRLPDKRTPAPKADISVLAWLKGHWIGAMPEGPVDHVILPPRFGHMPGFVRALSPDRVLFYEISVFLEVADSLSVRVKHFTPQLAGWEAQDAYIDRPLVAIERDRFFFDGISFIRRGPHAFTVYFLNRLNGVEDDTLVIPFRRA